MLSEIPAFGEIASHLANPLVLIGLALLLLVGVHRALIRSGILPRVGRKTSGVIIQSLLRYGFWVAVPLIVLGIAYAGYKIDEKLGHQEGMASDYGNLGGIAEDRGDIRRARELRTQARTSFAKIGMPHQVERVQGLLDGLPPLAQQAPLAATTSTGSAAGQILPAQAAPRAHPLGANGRRGSVPGHLKRVTAGQVVVVIDRTISMAVKQGAEISFELTPQTEWRGTQGQPISAATLERGHPVRVAYTIRHGQVVADRVLIQPGAAIAFEGEEERTPQPPTPTRPPTPGQEQRAQASGLEPQPRRRTRGQVPGEVRSATPDRLVVILDRDLDIWTTRGTEFVFVLTPETLVTKRNGQPGTADQILEEEAVTVTWVERDGRLFAEKVWIRPETRPEARPSAGERTAPEREASPRPRTGLREDAPPSEPPRRSGLEAGPDRPAASAPAGTATAPQEISAVPKDALVAFRQATELLNTGRPAEALPLLDRAIMLHPAYVEAHLWRGFAYKALEQPDKAMRDYDAAVYLSGSHPQILVARGNARGELGDFDAAFQDFSEAARRAPGAPAPPFNQGLVFKEKSEFDKALGFFDKAIEIDGGYAGAYMERGLLFLRDGLEREAQHEFERGERLKKGMRAQYAAQIENAQRETQAAPDRRGPQRSGGVVETLSLDGGVRLYVHERARESIRHFDAAIASDAENADAWLYRAKAYHDLRQYARALDDLDHAARLRRDDPEIHRMFGKIHVALGDRDRGVAALTRAIRLDPGSAMAYVDRGNIYLMHFPNLGGSAREDFEAAIRVEPTNPYAWYGRAATWSGVTFQVFTGARDYDPRAAIAAQIADVTEAIRLKPDFALAHASRGILHLSRAMSEMRTVQVQSDSAQGKADIERALALKPSLRPRIDAEVEALKSLPAFDARIRQTIAQLRASLQFDPAPFRSRSGESADSCANYRGGAANACRANDWMATERYNGGNATRKDREKYGDY